MFRIYPDDGRTNFYQYDTGQKLIVDGECDMVHLANTSTNAYVMPVDKSNADQPTVDVPDELLASNKTLKVYAWVQTLDAEEGKGHTLVTEKFSVTERAKPATYKLPKDKIYEYIETVLLQEDKSEVVDTYENGWNDALNRVVDYIDSI